MKSFLALLVLFFSLTANAATVTSSRSSSLLLAELMGDVLYFQLDNSSRSREKINSLIGLAQQNEVAASNAREKKLLLAVSQLMGDGKGRVTFDAEALKNAAYAYEDLVQSRHQADGKNAAFLVLDFRYRYLAMTLPSLSENNIIVMPLLRSVEDSFGDTDGQMKKLAGNSQGTPALKKWVFLRPRLTDYNNKPIPALANGMLLRIASELQGGAAPAYVSLRR